jgi:ribulose kinase
MHPAAPEAERLAEAAGLSLVEWLDREAARAVAGGASLPDLAGRVHVVPEFLGNRSPLADPDARAVIAGLGLERDLPSLVGLYVAGLLGIGYGLRQLLDRLREAGLGIDLIVTSGGAAGSPLVRQLLADATGVAVAASEAAEPVLLGAAMLGATAGASTRASQTPWPPCRGHPGPSPPTRARARPTTADTERSRPSNR